MTELKPISYKKQYEQIIANKIVVWLWSNIFKECFIILDENTVSNDNNILLSAIQSGLIYYQNNAFYSVKGRFSNKISKELEKLGAKYSKHRKAYILDKSKVPTEVLGTIEMLKAKTAGKVLALQTFLNYQIGELSKKENKINFDDAVEKIMMNLQDRVYKNAEQQKIELITPKLTDFRANEIAKRYTENLNFWIKNWTSENIIRMREVVGQMAIDGKSRVDISNYISKEFGISQRHAMFLAKNETAMATTSYLTAKYKEEGFVFFKWRTNIDGRERPLHKELNGHIFRFDNPPIIDERTGQTGLPGETYNCRCTFTPVATLEFWENRRKIFKAQNSLASRLKQLFK